MTPAEGAALVEKIRATVARFEALPKWERIKLAHLEKSIRSLPDAARALELTVQGVPAEHEHWQAPWLEALEGSVDLIAETLNQVVARRRKSTLN